MGNMCSLFRDKVLDDDQLPVKREKVDLLTQKLVRIELVKDNRLFPMLHVEKELIDELSVPWKDALAVKLHGRELELDTMKNRLESLGSLTGEFDLNDIGNGFFMVKFSNEEDKAEVINGVPWEVFGYSLLVRQWTSSFNAGKDSFKTMAWVRIPNLNVIYYDESFLWTLASAIGNPVMVDLQVKEVKFARLCVEIDYDEPQVRKVGINGEWYQVQYEDG